MPTVSGATYLDHETNSGVVRFEVTNVPVDEAEYVLDVLEVVVGIGIGSDPDNTHFHTVRPDLPSPSVGEETEGLCGKTWVVQAVGHQARYTRIRCPYCDAVLRIAHLFGLEGAFALRKADQQNEDLLLLVSQGVEAFRLTKEYVNVPDERGNVTLPDIEGWSHFDWTTAAKAVLEASE